ncbi:MAG: hypothetical protein R2822_27235 [Spirosomataceae bacterium]
MNPYITIWEDERNRGGSCNGDVYAQALISTEICLILLENQPLQANVCVGASVPITFSWLAQGFTPTFSATILDDGCKCH